MKNDTLKPGYLMQLNPELTRNKIFAGCFMVVTEVKEWGAQGYVQMTGENGAPGGLAYYRALWEEMEFCGTAVWVAN